MHLNSKDTEILKQLQNNAEISNARLAKQIGLSPSACLTRVRSLKSKGIIQMIKAELNEHKLGYSLHVFVYVKLDKQTPDALSYLEGAAKMNSSIQDCFRMTGEYDYMLRLLLRDTNDLDFFLAHELSRIPDIASIRTEVAMKNAKRGHIVPLK